MSIFLGTPLDPAHRIGLSTFSKDVLLTAVCGWRSQKHEIGHVFRHISTTGPRTSKGTTPSDPAHRIGLSTLSKDVLNIYERVCRWRLKNREIGHNFRHTSTTRACTAKRTTPLDWPHRLGLSTLSKDFMTVTKESVGGDLNFVEFSTFLIIEGESAQ